MNIITTKILTATQLQSAYEIWLAEYPIQIGYKNISEFINYLSQLSNIEYFIACNPDNDMLGLAYVFDRNNEKWFAIMLNAKYQGGGIGSKLIKKVQQNYVDFNGWITTDDNLTKFNNDVYRSPINFYLKNNFTIIKDVVKNINGIDLIKINWKKI